jgi:hypothetical protein
VRRDQSSETSRPKYFSTSPSTAAAQLHDVAAARPIQQGSLTIDDGTGAAREAAILARQHGHAVTLFVNPYHVETGEPYWFSLLNAALDAAREQVVTYAGETYWIGGCEGKQKLRSNVKEAIGSLSVESMRREHVGAVAALLRSGDVRLPSFLNVLRIPELRELLALGVRIENHGWTHTDLGQAPCEVVLREVNDGHDWLLRRLGIQAGVFAAPFGQALPPPGFCREFGYRWLLLTDRFPCRRIQEGVFNRGDLAARVTTIFQEDCGSLGGQISTPPIQNPGKHLKVLFLGEEPLRDAPTLTLAAGLKQNHIDSLLGGQAARATGWRFLRLALQVDVILYISYGGPGRRTLASLALAALLGRPIVRRWVGTDVLMCLRSAEARAAACLLDPLVSQNIAAAPHLVQELASVGLKACCIPSPVARCAAVREDQEVPKALLVYLPSGRLDFYGEALVRRAVEVNPDVEFVVVGDDTHALAGYSNVRSLGWVDDMGPVLARVGGLLRLTEHDGMPRLVLDCLLRGT